MTERRWLTIEQASQELQIPRKSLYRLIGQQKIPPGAVRRDLGRSIRLRASWVETGELPMERKT